MAPSQEWAVLEIDRTVGVEKSQSPDAIRRMMRKGASFHAVAGDGCVCIRTNGRT